MALKLNDRRLWGNEAADDEDPSVLNAYFVNQPDWHEFFNVSIPLSIARARKGMGKSALIRECAYRSRDQKGAVIIEIKGSDLVAQKPFATMAAAEHIYDWQQRICAIINRKIGSSIGVALSDDSIAMVEAAELSGFKSRNLVGSLVDRIKGKLGPVELQKLGINDHQALLSRFLDGRDERVLVLIDDIDATFTDSPQETLRLSTFFSACRQLATSFSGIALRTVIRSDVWATIRKRDEALDKVEQYIFDISWSVKGFRSFLASRITAYCDLEKQEALTQGKSKEEIIEIVFEPKFPWGDATAFPHRVVHVYAGGRPRWAAQLCRMAGAEAARVRSQLIKFGHIKQVLEEYGRYRLDDLAREHRHQCEVIADVVNAFSKRSDTYTTQELKALIDEKVLQNFSVCIDGTKATDAFMLARFLYRIGFILGLDRDEVGRPEYYQFEEKPDLLKSAANYDDGMKWRVHPSYHSALDLSH